MFFNESVNKLTESDIPASNLGLTPDMDGIRMIQEASTEEWFNLREKMMRCEHAAIVNEDTFLLESGVGDFFKKVADWFRKMVSYVKEIFAKFVAWLDAKFMKDAEFVKKYEKVVMNKDINKFEYNGHAWKYDNLAGFAQTAVGKVTSDPVGRIGKVQNSTAADVTEIKKSNEEKGYLKVMGFEDAEDMKTKIWNSFCEKEYEKETLGISYIKMSDMLGTIKNKDKNVKEVQKLKDDQEKFFNTMAKDFDKISGQLSSQKNTGAHTENETKAGAGKSDDFGTSGSSTDQSVGYASTEVRNAKREYASQMASYARSCATTSNTLFGYSLDAVKQRSTEFRSVIAAVVGYNAPKSESYSFSNENAGVLDQF